MVIASIDVRGGKVVQLRQGQDLVLERDNAEELAREFNKYGEVAVIDLDAAAGTGSNIDMIKSLLRIADCRAGGGIRSAEQARELVSLGAKKIITGSNAFRDPAKKGAGVSGGEFAVNTEFLAGLAEKTGRERVIVAVDAKKNAAGEYEIVVDGWKTFTGLPLIAAARAAEKYAAELLFTCVDREGTMTGTDFEIIKRLRESVSCLLTVAGGISTIDEITVAANLGCDVQLGMALYTGKISLAESFAASLNWKKGNMEGEGGAPPCAPALRASAAPHTGDTPVTPPSSPPSPGGQEILPVIAQNTDGQVLMTGFADRNAVLETFRRSSLCFYSRTRKKLWMKGETSGNTLRLVSLRADCDRDAILATVEPAGPACHTGAWSCFAADRRYTWEYLYEIIAERFRNPVPGSYTATLDNDLVRGKIMEEAQELCEAKTRDEIVWEAADLLYFATALLARENISVQDVLNELDRRHKK